MAYAFQPSPSFPMRYFLKSVATSKLTLPIVCTLAVLTLTFQTLPIDHFAEGESGLWRLIPLQLIEERWTQLAIRIGLLALSIYLLAELNISFVLLRVRSRMISSLFTVLFIASVFLHLLQPSSVIAPVIIIAYFALFSTYQQSNAVLPTYSFYLLIALCSLIFPKILFMIPVFWVCQTHLRSFSFRAFWASIVGLSTPYWFLFFYSLVQMDRLQLFCLPFQQLASIQMPDYAALSLPQWLMLGYTFLVFLFGFFNFLGTSYLDKTRVRITYDIVIIIAFAAFVFIVLQPQCFNPVFIFCIINTAILSGRYFAQNDSRAASILFIILTTIVTLITLFNLFQDSILRGLL